LKYYFNIKKLQLAEKLVIYISDCILLCFKDKDVKIIAIETHFNLN